MPNIIKLIIIFSRVKKPFPSSAREPKKHVLCSSTKRKAKCHVVNVTTEVAGPSMRWNWPELLPDTAVTVSPEHLEPFQKWQLKVISRVIKIGKHTKSSLFWYWAGAEERDRACHVRRNQFIAVEKEEEREREKARGRRRELLVQLHMVQCHGKASHRHCRRHRSLTLRKCAFTFEQGPS